MTKTEKDKVDSNKQMWGTGVKASCQRETQMRHVLSPVDQPRARSVPRGRHVHLGTAEGDSRNVPVGPRNAPVAPRNLPVDPRNHFAPRTPDSIPRG